ncbi:MAG: polysaccharide biosynthesis tyrosine autokinase [Clostridia bacterium]|nr:polysaccharide biosynthesis tyrosine autokinase [Clostridia bacterium]
MENSKNNASNGIEINFVYLIEALLKKWWLIVLLTVAMAFGGVGITKLTVTPTYSSGISFVVNAISGESTDSSYNEINGSIKIANTFSYVLSSRILYFEVLEDCKNYNLTESELNSAVKVTAQDDTNVIEMTITTDSADKSKAIADSVIEHYEEVTKRAFPNIGLTVINPPIKASNPDTNNSYLRNLVIGGFLGFAISALIVVITNAAKTTIREADDIEEKLGVSVLGSVAHVEKNDKKNSKDKRPLLINDTSNGFAFVETYKAIRTKIESVSIKNGYKTFMITSASENEGKTTVAINIAIGLAQNGKSVLVIDADLRKPAVCKMLGVNTGVKRGLADVINGNTTLNKSIRYVEKYNICLLAGSSSVADPSEVLSSSAMDKIIKMAESEFDYVIIDTAPAGVVTDATVVTNYADACILVVREDRATVSAIRNVIDDVSNGKAKIIGCVFNNIKKSVGNNIRTKYQYGGRYGYGYSKGYGYGYGYGYPNDENRNDENPDNN